MSLRSDMELAARAAVAPLADAAPAVVAFLQGKAGPSGGFVDRAGQEDLYYTVFGAGALSALRAPLPEQFATYLQQFGDGGALDFVHLTCLARCWALADAAGRSPAAQEGGGGAPGRHGPKAAIPGGDVDSVRASLARGLAETRTEGGGFRTAPDEPATAYACFLGVGAFDDVGSALPDPDHLLACLETFRAEAGGYANDPGQDEGLAPITAGIVSLRRLLGAGVDDGTIEWLIGQLHPEGGFVAAPGVPLADLLSTATVLHALVGTPGAVGRVKDPCLRFLDTVWDEPAGAFRGYALDDQPDCEYTWYGLLALGHLST